MTEVEFVRISFSTIAFLFFVYIGLHAGLGFWHKKIKKDLADKLGNIDLEHQDKYVGWAFKWFPAVYVMALIIFLG